MLSRAHLLIEKELERLQSDRPWGIEASPLRNDNIFEWVAKIQGLVDTLWEGAIFHLYIKFDEHYNIRPPEICFHTVPYHPNVDMVTGRPCIDYLDDYDKWNESNSLSLILVTIQHLLSNPTLENPVNIEAAEMYKHLPNVYKQTIQKCVAASKRFEASVATGSHLKGSGSDLKGSGSDLKGSDLKSTVMFAPEKDDTTKQKPLPPPEPPRITKLSFDDYYTTWCGIATSKPKNNSRNPLLEQIKNLPERQRVHVGICQDDIKEQIRRQMEESSALVYGRLKNKSPEKDDKTTKMEKLQKMRKIYLPHRVSSSPPPQNIELEGELHGINAGKDEMWEKEVDDLVAWTNKLDANAIDT